ncbi:MAG: dTDP-4-dehydrorhamnose reductase [Planctomycetes bacterium]|nr:dTDP-4-dehydrorhamnose reductase [Planctomycetota bacterium]
MTPGRSEKILVAGASGMLGSELINQLRARGNWQIVETAFSKSRGEQIRMDMTDSDAVEKLIADIKPAVVFNCAAYTDVDKAEETEDVALAVNGYGVGHLASACKRQNCFLVHVSSDYVFNGSRTIPYLPTDPRQPQSAYGRSKLLGEEQLLTHGDKWAMVRTSWMFGLNGKNFIETILTLAKTKTKLNVVNDQTGCPTFTADLSKCLIDMGLNRIVGTHHFCNGPQCTWFDFAKKAIELSGLDCVIEPCLSEQYPRPAKRPTYSVLDCHSTFDRLGWRSRNWSEALEEYIEKSKEVSVS